MSSSFCTFYLVRHGETEWNVQNKLTGHTDIPLNKAGENQAKELKDKLQSIHFDKIFSSDLIRAKQTAEIIATERKLLVTTSTLLRERNFGDMEGQSVEEQKKLLELYREMTDEEILTHKPNSHFETNDELMTRFITFLREVAVGFANKNVLIVSHGSILRTFLIHVGFTTHKLAPYRMFPNGAYVKILSDGVDFFVKETEGIILNVTK